MMDAYRKLKAELLNELKAILSYWSIYGIDDDHGGFVGRRDFHNNLVPEAPKGIILNTRLLWSFSAAANFLKSKEYESFCHRAYRYLNTYFRDTLHEGVFWEVDHAGTPINQRKQVYAQAFAIYALTEYYRSSHKKEALDWAVSLFKSLETYAKDSQYSGYFEAFHKDWSPIGDMRLSKKDMNSAKSMNTHLHILEAYTNLLRVHNNEEVKHALRQLIILFQDTLLDSSNHYGLFFDEKWKLMSSTVSFGHDIETAWLVIEAAKALNDNELVEQTQKTAIRVIDTFVLEALDTEGAVMNERETTSDRLDTDRHWWPQVEALLGLDLAYKLTQDSGYIKKSLDIWNFTKKYLIDHKNGEWHFRVDAYGNPYTQEDKVSMWKAPYHTTRACILMNQ
ncbi:AGE family epimerase/isomerase [Flagellimonas crocea]|uniref:AGE family epimerase/isomerase n=1 Tax=Flagellimonas crocea TaxID=3067311 RepID=UPI00296EE9E9|nr:AGE family epimerase/isomerase [Muricauda sp. DH64]